MLVPMSRVRVVGLKEYFAEMIEFLQEFGRIHFEDITPQIESGELPIGGMKLFERSSQEREVLVEQLQQTRAILKGLFDDAEIRPETDQGFDQMIRIENSELIERAREVLLELGDPAAALVAKLEALEAELAELQRYEPLLETVEPIVTRLLEDGNDRDAVALIVEKRFEPVFDEFRAALEGMTDGQAELVVEDASEETLAAVAAFPKRHRAAVHAFLSGENVNQISLPAEYMDEPLPDALDRMRIRIESLPGLVTSAAAEIAAFGRLNRDRLANMRNAITDRIAQLDMIESFGETRYTFVISGFLPEEDLSEFRRVLDERWGDDVVIEECTITMSDYSEVPVKMENSKRWRPFEAALGIWGLPKYGSIDPTRILAYSFPFLFGMIVGDAGYGLTLLLIVLFLKWKFPRNQAAQIFAGFMLPTAIMTIIVGIFYWEFFGDLAILYIPGLRDVQPIHFGESFSIPFIRTHMLTTFLIMAIAAGVIHVSIGLVLGIINAKKVGDKSHGRMRAGILTVVFGALLIGALILMPGITAGMSPVAGAVLKYVAYFVLGIGFVLTIWGGGIMGAIETIETVANMASYIRIMAVGLVGALLADATNQLMFVTMPNIGGIIIGLILHVLNFAIILFSPSIHALRLNFLEFFGKFFERGEVEYRPFVRSSERG